MFLSENARAMSTPARKRLMRDFKRLQVRGRGVAGVHTVAEALSCRLPERAPTWCERHADGEQHHAVARRHLRARGHAVGGRCVAPPWRACPVQRCALKGADTPRPLPLWPGTFKLTLTFTEDYPNKAPTVRFESKMFHPNSASRSGGEPGTAWQRVCALTRP